MLNSVAQPQADYGDFNSENDSSRALYMDDLENKDFEKFTT